jgi:hypothetical protein
MAEKKCCLCGKGFGPGEQVAALNEHAIQNLEAKNPDMNAGPSVATDPAGNRRWVICVPCARKYTLP